MLVCQYCGKECKNKNSLAQHERLCKFNPNKQESSFIKYNNDKTAKHSNRFIKAKEEGRIIEVSQETRDKISKAFKGKKHSQETKNKISQSYKSFLENHPDKIGWIINHSSKKSYAEKYFEEVFKNENINLKYHKQIGRYELDFYNEDLMKYIEIDGHQHTDSEYMIQHDKDRDLYLENLGWKGMRIRWSEYKKLNIEERKNIIYDIKLFIQ